MVVVGALGLFVLIFLPLIGSFERSFECEISVEPFKVVNIFDDVT